MRSEEFVLDEFRPLFEEEKLENMAKVTFTTMNLWCRNFSYGSAAAVDTSKLSSKEMTVNNDNNAETFEQWKENMLTLYEIEVVDNEVLPKCVASPYIIHNTYNVAIVTFAMLLSELAYTTGVPASNTNTQNSLLPLLQYHPQCNSLLARAKMAPPSALLLGLGAGDLHAFLLHYHKCLWIDAVETSPDVINIAKHAFGLQTCGVTGLRSSHLYKKEGRNSTARKLNDNCRSHIIIGDAWNVMGAIVEELPGVSYDFIVADVYDLICGLWDGKPHQGNSNPDVADVLKGIQNAKNLLNEETGLAIFHLHMDVNFARLLREMQMIFSGNRNKYNIIECP